MKFKCGICNKEFEDIQEYLTHVSNCANKKNEEEIKSKENLKEINGYLDEIKLLQKELNRSKTNFKSKYPKEYELNFKENKECCKEEDNKNEDYFYGNIDGKEYEDFKTFMKELQEECGLRF